MATVPNEGRSTAVGALPQEDNNNEHTVQKLITAVTLVI
jgi:hypothetical protein